MALTRLHGIYAVKIGSTVLGGITGRSIDMNSDVRQEPTSGEVYSRFQALYHVKPMAKFGTKQLAAALDVCSLAGLRLTSGTTGIFYAQKQQPGGSRASGSVHRTYTVNEGLLVPRSISCAHGGDAELRYEILPSTDGTNAPIVAADTAALATAPSDAERFTLGPVTLAWSGGSLDVGEKTQVNLEFGIQADTVGADSDLYDSFARMVEVQPSLTITGLDIEWFKSTNVPITGRDITHASTSITFRKRAAGSTFVADATAEHIGLTAAGLATIEQICDAQGNGLDSVQLRLPLKFDGTNAPFVLDTTFALA